MSQFLDKEPSFLNEADFTVFFNTYNEHVFGYIQALVKSQEVAVELTQDVFLKLWTVRDTLYHIGNIDGYMYTISRNVALNHLRKLKSDQRMLDELRNYMVDQTRDTEEYFTYQDYTTLVTKVVDTLSPQRKLVYLLSREEGLSIDEIAARLNLSRNTVKNHLVSALAIIRQYLQEKGGIIMILTLFIIF